MDGILLTGATGFVGSELLSRLLKQRPGAAVYCLMRRRGRKLLEERLRELLDWAGVSSADAHRVHVVDGNLTDDDLGMGARRAELAAAVGEIFHTAATTRFDLELERARQVNCGGLARVVEFAREAQAAGGLRRLHHVSTAFSVGEPGGCADEPSFRNAYEQSKWETERHLEAVDDALPWTIYRPSIIVGDSRTGRTRHFRVLYEPIKWVYLGGMTILPVRTEVRLDVVPIDYVCDAIMAIARRDDSAGRSYRLTCGEQKAILISEFAKLVALYGHQWQREHGEPETPEPTLVDPNHLETLTGEERENFEKLFAIADHVAKDHLPYMLVEQLFESPETEAALAGTGIVCPALRDYMRPIINYAVDNHFGVPIRSLGKQPRATGRPRDRASSDARLRAPTLRGRL